MKWKNSEEVVILPHNAPLPPLQLAVEVDQKHNPLYLQPVEQVGQHHHPPLPPPAEQVLVQHENPTEYLHPIQNHSVPQPTEEVQHPYPHALQPADEVGQLQILPVSKQLDKLPHLPLLKNLVFP